jgi:beta-N-acetylhexosaminidase
MVDIAGTGLTPEDREVLRHPLVGGVILFSRNYADPEQMRRLTGAIHALRTPHLLVAVDHEGGRVQRFRAGFTLLPAAATLGRLHDRDPALALARAETTGRVLAGELRAVGVDLSFAPILDLHWGRSRVIGDRAFHRDPQVVAELARATIRGMHQAGMAAVGKHFPGHGAVEADSHETLPVDGRRLEDIQGEDLLAFERAVRYGLPAIMPAHVVFPALDSLPAGFSRRWLTGVLRERLGFAGAVFSDDLSMAGAAVAGGPLERAEAALDAGCDTVLICHDRPGVERILDGLRRPADPVAHSRLARLHGRPAADWDTLHRDPDWVQARRTVEALEGAPELALGDDSAA